MSAFACCPFAPEPEPTPTPGAADLQILSDNLDCTEGTLGLICHLTGAVKNIGDRDAEEVVVKAEFFDANGVKLSDDFAYVGNLRAGKQATYDVVYDGAQVPSTYEVWAEPGEFGLECFIATAAYGTSSAAELDTLRAFRDEVLLQNSLGSRLVALYYEISPPLADFISEHEVLRTLVRELLVDPVVWVVEATEPLWRD